MLFRSATAKAQVAQAEAALASAREQLAWCTAVSYTHLDVYKRQTWTFIDSKTVQTEEGYVPPIHDFSIADATTGEDITQEVSHDKG